ncbi:unnamed protein product [Lymnaea stagnalis]|uniref:LRAT domain-containing protein n=1 Tax=Lymnaea stagnalis TaxID=6523 RepID=A0AAV2HF14_LYMST
MSFKMPTSKGATFESAAIKRHNQHLLNKLKPGDLVKFDRGVYHHWAVYVGNGKLIHFINEESNYIPQAMQTSSMVLFPNDDKARIVEQDFWAVVGDSKADFGNMESEGWIPLDRHTIVERARSCLGPAKYNLYSQNCEHFAKWCRYNRAKSDQVDDLVKTSKTLFQLATLGSPIHILLDMAN